MDFGIWQYKQLLIYLESETKFKTAKLPVNTKKNKKEHEFACFSISYFTVVNQTFNELLTEVRRVSTVSRARKILCRWLGLREEMGERSAVLEEMAVISIWPTTGLPKSELSLLQLYSSIATLKKKKLKKLFHHSYLHLKCEFLVTWFTHESNTGWYDLL